MSKASENVSDRELFSELFENPIHPLLINIVPPFVNENSPMFHFQLNGEAVWRWREVCGQPSTVFELLQSSVLPLGYRLAESAHERVGRAFAESIRRFWRKIQDSKNTKKRKQMQAETWLKLGVKVSLSFAKKKRHACASFFDHKLLKIQAKQVYSLYLKIDI